MATASKVQLSLDHCGEFHLPGITKESAAKGTKLLQENHDNHHVFFNAEGFHNHIAHHLLTLYALGATPEQMQQHYDRNKSYQRPPQPLDDTVLKDLHDPTKYRQYLANERYYHDFLVYFQEEIDKKGYQEVINEYLFSRDERANDMLVRMFAGFLHPAIHLGFGVEFQQPAIVAEALAQAAVHSNWIGQFLLGAEEAAASTGVGKSLVQLLDEIRADKKLSTAAHWDDSNKIRDGIMVRAPNEMIKYASQFKVKEEELDVKTAEMINAAIYYTGGAQRPPKQVKFDFYYMHCVNCSIFFSAFLKAPWFDTRNKVRLLEWKGRIDLCIYTSRSSPEPLMDEIINYEPAQPGASSWKDVHQRICEHQDDGHGSKLVRAIAHGEEICKPFNDASTFPIQGPMWQQLGNMVIDSVEDTGDPWVRSAGFDEAWTKYEDRPRAQL